MRKLLSQLPVATVLYWRIAFFAATIATTAISLAPARLLPDVATLSDKLQHLLTYAVLALLARFAWMSARSLAAALCGLILLSGAVEIAQNFVAGRHGEWLDLAANAAGLVVGLALSIAFSSGPRNTGSRVRKGFTFL